MFFYIKKELFVLIIMKEMPIKTIHCQCLPNQQEMIENYQLSVFSGIMRKGACWEKHTLAQIAQQDLQQNSDIREYPEFTALL